MKMKAVDNKLSGAVRLCRLFCHCIYSGGVPSSIFISVASIMRCNREMAELLKSTTIKWSASHRLQHSMISGVSTDDFFI